VIKNTVYVSLHIVRLNYGPDMGPNLDFDEKGKMKKVPTLLCEENLSNGKGHEC